MKTETGNSRVALRYRQVHILIISQYFYPETFRINDMAVEWVKRGYKVTAVTGIPNYPMGKFFDGYGYQTRRRERWKGVEIIRLPLIPRGRHSIGMAANYISFAASGLLWKSITKIRADLVFTFEVSPMTQALAGVWYKKKFHVPHFLYVQDLWPENVEEITGIHSPFLLKPVGWMADYIYENADRIFTPSVSFADAVAGRGVNRNRIYCWPQYAERFYKRLERKTARSRAGKESPVHRIPDDGMFTVAFTGNIGTAQGLDILPKAAEILKKKNSPAVRFVIVGDGRYQGEFEQEIRAAGVQEMFLFIPRQDAGEIPKLLACCDAAFLSFGRSKLWEMTVPAKLQSYMACGMPVIAAVQGETRRVINEAGCGVCCDAGDAGGLAGCIWKLLAADGELLKQMGKNSLKYCRRHYDKTALMNEMDRHIADELGLDSTGDGFMEAGV